MENKSIEQIEYELKRLELENRQKEGKKRLNISQAIAAIIVATMTVVGSFVANYIQKNREIELQKLKLESELIIKAVESNDIQTSRSNLIFFIEAGLLPRSSINIEKILDDTSIVILQIDPYTKRNPIYSLDGRIVLPINIDLSQVKIVIWPHSTSDKTKSLRQELAIDEKGRFRISNMEEINYVLEISSDNDLLKRILYSPNPDNPKDFITIDLTSYNKK